MPTAPAKLVVASSEESADILYATKIFVPDAFVLLVHGGRSTILLSDLEVDRGRREAAVDEVLSLSAFATEHKKALGRRVTFARLIAHFLKTRGVRRAVVPPSFPLGLGLALAREGVQVTPPKKGEFFPERARKTPAELGHLRRALEITAAGMARGLEVLGAAGGANPGAELHWGGVPLTSERLRAEIDTAVVRLGGAPKDTIVAGGEQGCDPHERGSGPLRAGELIVIDLFPRDTRTGYFGDLTRTVVKGRASDAQRRLWATVQEGQRRAIAGTRAGADGIALHEGIKKFFKDQGYPTDGARRTARRVFPRHGPRPRAGIARGAALQPHAQLRGGQRGDGRAGAVLSRGLGGVRIEDVVAVTARGLRPALGLRAAAGNLKR